MQKCKRLGIILLVILSLASCKKSGNDEQFNVLTITSGSDSGFTFVYSPNKGFWSTASATAKYIHLVFGDVDNNTVTGKDIMSILFYYEGNNTIDFPSAQGQHINIGITVSGAEKYYSADDATLTVSELTDSHLKGTVTGTFISNGPSFDYVDMKMDIDIDLQEII